MNLLFYKKLFNTINYLKKIEIISFRMNRKTTKIQLEPQINKVYEDNNIYIYLKE